MVESYEGLIADHQEIEELAANLVADLGTLQRADAGVASQALARLAEHVEWHVSRENAVMTSMEGREAAAAWGADWTAVKASFEDLRARWVEFITRWDPGSVAAEWPQFRLEARSVLIHLQDQVTRETDLFYSAALRVGAVSLRA